MAGSIVGLVWWAAGRRRWGGVPFLVAVVSAANVMGRSDWPRWIPMVGVGAVVTLLSAVGAARLLADPAIHWTWVATAALISATGVWVGVPETGPVMLAAGGLIGLLTTAVLTRAQWGPMAGVGVVALLGWAAMSGAAARPWATLGGALCTGVAPWFALRPPPRRRRHRPRAWLLGAHAGLVILAARWIGVDPHAGWARVAIVAFAGMAVAVMTQRQA